LIVFLNSRFRRLSLLLLITAWLGVTAAARACSIDGIPSLSLDGRLVTFNYGQATKENISYWAAFSLGTATANKEVYLREDLAKIRKALSPKAFITPFRWTFGDGASASGQAVQHRYRRPGWYKVNVDYYYPPQRKWIVFDSAQLHVLGVPGAAHNAASAGLAPQLAGGSLAAVAGLALVVLGARRRMARTQTPGTRPGTRARSRARTRPNGRKNQPR
jgi:hypothetical protein